jgi:hypothetical protein
VLHTHGRHCANSFFGPDAFNQRADLAQVEFPGAVNLGPTDLVGESGLRCEGKAERDNKSSRSHS